MPDVNIPLLRKAVEWAESEALKPRALSEWEQAYFVLPDSDSSPLLDGLFGDWRPSSARQRLGKAAECGTCYCIAGYVDQVVRATPSKYPQIQESATDALGLSMSERDALFDAANTIEDVRRIAEEIAGERL